MGGPPSLPLLEHSSQMNEGALDKSEGVAKYIVIPGGARARPRRD
jgi:hypothetical protein